MEDFEQIDRNVAESDFEMILKAARCKWNIYCMIEGNDAEKDKELIIDAIMDRRVTVNDQGFPTLHTEEENEKLQKIFMRRMKDSDLLAMDRVKDGHNHGKTNAAIGKWVGLAPAMIGLLDRKDKVLLETLWCIFL